MGPKTGPRPASSTPRMHGVPGSVVEESEDGDDGRSVGGTGEKYVWVSPARVAVRSTEGGM